MFFANFGVEFRIVQQQIGEFRALLHKVQLRHPLSFALEFLSRNPDQLAQDISGVIERKGLVKIAGEEISLCKLFSHMAIRLARAGERPIKNTNPRYYSAVTGLNSGTY